MDDDQIEALVRRGLRSQKYLRALHAALEENYNEAVKEGDGVRAEMFMAGLVFVRDSLDVLSRPKY